METRAYRPVARISGSLLLIVLSLGMLSMEDARSERIPPQLALDDFDRLKGHLSAAWANLDWSVNGKGIDLNALSEQTRAALLQVETAGEARSVLRGFVQSLDDPHLIVWEADASAVRTTSRPAAAREATALGRDTSARKACKAMGFRKRGLGFKLRFPSRPGYTAVESDDRNPFVAGVLPLQDGRRVGLLRIAHFGDDGYPDVCRELWPAYRETIDTPCTDRWCDDFRTVLRDRLLRYLEARIQAMQRLGYDLLVVDITGNGGGNEWAVSAAQVLSPLPLKCSRQAFVKHEHWQWILERTRTSVAEDLMRDDLPEATRSLLATADRNLDDLIAETTARCDMTPIWSGEAVSEGCTNLVRGAYYSCGVFSHLEDRQRLEPASRPAMLYQPIRNQFRASSNVEPVAILVDRATASASEDFASVLQDNGAATIIGGRTYGAGCGFVNGGITIHLEHVKLNVKAPDCARIRRDGSNEMAGVEPDVRLGWSDDSRSARTEKALAALAEIPL